MDLQKLVDEIREEFPDFSITRKSGSTFMKVLNVLLMIVTFGTQRRFMTKFTTVIGNVVYVPSAWDEWNDRIKDSLLRHERVHMRQAKRYGRFAYSFLYLFIWFPLGFAWYRTKFEMEAYEESMRLASVHLGASILQHPKYREKMIGHFTTGEYGWMWPFKKRIEKWYDRTCESVRKST